MKNLIITVLLITTVVFGALALKQNQKKNEAEATVAKLEETTATLQTKVDEQEKRTENLKGRLQESRTEQVSHAVEISHLETALTNQQQQAASNTSNPLGEMFKNKDMREMIKKQQKLVLGPMIEKNYADLFKTLNFQPEQTATLKDLVVKRSLVDANMGVSMMAGDTDPEKRKELMDQAKTDKDSINEEIKGLLGDDNYAEFQAYEKTLGARMQVNAFKEQQGSGPLALNADQENRLMQMMNDEKQNFKFTTDFTDQSKFDGDFTSMFTDERMKTFEQEQGQLNKQYLEHAKDILSPEQFTSYEKFLNTQTEMQRMGLKMAAQMFGSKTGGK